MKIAEWTDSATMDMERISDEPIPSSSSDLERIEEMILEHEKFMTELSEWHKELEPVVSNSVKMKLVYKPDNEIEYF